jgi:uncharacterized protein YejL (UPF0352 family)
MAWEYSTASISAVAASQAGAISYVDSVLAVIDALTGWSVGAAAVNSVVSAKGLATHSSGARLSIVGGAVGGGGGATAISASNSYTGASLLDTTIQATLMLAYFPSDETGSLPLPNTGVALAGQFLYSRLSDASYYTATTSRIHAWADGDKIILAVQRNTSITTINDVFFAGALATNLINTGDAEDQIQWIMPAFTAATNSATGAGQARDSAGTRILSMTPIAPNYLLDVNRQSGAGEFTLLPIWYASPTTNVATGNGIKGLIDPDAVVAGSAAVTLRATVDSEARVHIGAGYYMPWDTIYSPML